MVAQPMTIGGITFDTKGDAESYIKTILHSYRAPARVAPMDEAFIIDLLQRHRRADEKIGVGIAAIHVARLGFGTQGFMVEWIDGTRVDFSYKVCLRPKTHATDVKFALRRAIADQVIAVKQSVFPSRYATLPCPITGETMTYTDAHVDHEPPLTFAALVETYLQERGLTFDDIPVYEPPDGIGKHLASEQAADWAAWHQRHARLRVISAYANERLVR